MAGLKVNFSTEELGSESRDFEVLPAGKYPVRITEVEMKECGPNSKNPGKPFWAVEYTIVEGHPNAERKFWTNIMLFDGALYSFVQLAKALGGKLGESMLSGEVPDLDELEGKELVVRVNKQRDTYRENKLEEEGERSKGDAPIFKNEIKGHLPATASTTAAAPAAKGGKSSILP